MYLNCHSYYSLRYGTMSVEQLVQKAVAAEADIIALTDINNSTGMPEFVAECNKHSIKPVTGIEFRNGNDLSKTLDLSHLCAFIESAPIKSTRICSWTRVTPISLAGIGPFTVMIIPSFVVVH